MIDDLIAATRGLWRAKSFAAAAIVTLSLGIAGVAVLLTFIHGVMFRPLPIIDQERVIVAWKQLPSNADAPMPFGGDAIRAAGEASTLLEAVGGVSSHAVASWPLVDADSAGYVKGALVTGSFFDVLGTPPVLGRALTANDDRAGSERVIVISAALWKRRYGATPDIVGRRVTIDELPFAIVGVMPPDSDYPRGVEAWRSTSTVKLAPPFGDAARQEVNLIARMRPGVSMEQAAVELDALTRRYEEALPPDRPRGMRPVISSFEDVLIGDVRPTLIALLAAVSLVFLIACANVANLLLLRGEARRSEVALREALGAARGRIVRQLFAEGVVLTAIATAAALLVTSWGLQTLLALVPDALPRVEAIRIDTTVTAFVAAIALLACLLAGAAPAWFAARLDLVSQLRGDDRGIVGGRRNGRRSLVIAQVALAVIVAAAAGVVNRSLLRLQSIDTGVAAEQLWFVSLSMPQSQYADRTRHTQFLSNAIEALSATPQFTSVTSVNTAPFAGGWSVPRFTIEHQPADAAAANPPLNLEAVRGNFFNTMGVRLISGRAFNDDDRAGTQDVAIVSEDLARIVGGGAEVVGKRIKMGPPDGQSRWMTIVGVAAAVRYRDLTAEQATLYVPVAQLLDAAQTLAIRTAAPAAVVAGIARERVQAIDPSVNVMSVSPFAERMAGALAQPRFNALLLTSFGAAALFLAAIGQYAVIAAFVRHREREIALRMALGASPRLVRQLVWREALMLGGIGAAIGLGGSTAIGKVSQRFLFGLDGLDLMTLAGAVLLLLIVTLVAAYVPVRRAMRVDAVEMLKG
jgi:putative ABC transport system permease protein